MGLEKGVAEGQFTGAVLGTTRDRRRSQTPPLLNEDPDNLTMGAA